MRPTIYIRGEKTIIGTMAIDGYYSSDSTKNSTISHLLVEGEIDQLSISNATINRKYKELPNNSMLLTLKDHGRVNYLQFDRVSTTGIASILSNSTGYLKVINASNIIHINSSRNSAFYLNNRKNIVEALNVTNFFSNGQVCKGSTVIRSKKGDAFQGKS